MAKLSKSYVKIVKLGDGKYLTNFRLSWKDINHKQTRK
jgi:hypothetical protein